MSDFDLNKVYDEAEAELQRIDARQASIKAERAALDAEYRTLTEKREAAKRLLASRQKRTRKPKPVPGQSVRAHAQTAEATGTAMSIA
jgi:chromosome segregation ATPase